MRKLLIAFAVALFLGLIGLGLFGDRGLISYHKLRRDRVKLEQDADQLRKENQSLRQKIELLGSDLKYLEKLARQKQYKKNYKQISEKKLIEIWPDFYDQMEMKLTFAVLANKVM